MAAPRPKVELGPDDAALVVRARGGDRWAAETLYRRHVADATRIAAFLLRRSAEVEDVVQDAFVTALARLGTLREPSAFGGWVARIVANEARGRLRRRHLLGLVGLDAGTDDALLAQLAAPGATAEQRTELALIDRALGTLGPDERLAWTLRFVEGWKLTEVAETMRLSLATVKRRLVCAQQRVAAIAGTAVAGFDPEGEEP